MAVVTFAAVIGLVIVRERPADPIVAGGIPTTPLTSATGTDSPPPWPALNDLPAAVGQSGLPLLR
ncbi:hypothetical protein MARA_61880 [Mycolicibacterium arabiense]|jgi:hypothetical protein|uniref:Uncharacterized protein n=1 Tax=Mycolicibacterium arabiense TaxID=1286181 RepID=A0A7I7S897_9MYCO|nr:hypothetical protein [Mycolicibacterium arabiense]MCV7376379.1 hypothetical protein [Mycolicibacterium arabiense]BBY52720.1 hypothetical protein MARA_61880 [Mycolicibacterium arabiense]